MPYISHLAKRRPPNLPYISELPVAHPLKAHLNMPQLPRIRKDHPTPVQPRGEHAPPSSKSDRNSPFLSDSEEALHLPTHPQNQTKPARFCPILGKTTPQFPPPNRPIPKIRQNKPTPARFRGSLPTSPQPPPQTTLIPRVKQNPPRSRPIPGKPAQSAPSHPTPPHATPPRTAPFAQSTERR